MTMTIDWDFFSFLVLVAILIVVWNLDKNTARVTQMMYSALTGKLPDDDNRPRPDDVR